MANSYLNRTPSSTGNRRKFTISAWLKRSKLGSTQIFANAFYANSDSGFTSLRFNGNDKLEFTGWSTAWFISSQLFRDTSAWYHIVVAVDTENSTAGDRIRAYVNGSEITAFDTENNPSVNQDLAFNVASYINDVGANRYQGSSGVNTYDGYISHFALVDGQQLAPTVFGETDSTSGIWKFKSPSGVTWGTNGFHLKFENSGNLGLDSSGNTNNFTVNGNLRQALDTPSNVYVTLNPLDFGGGADSNASLSLGNTKGVSGAANWRHSHGTLGVTSGKWYYEAKGSGTPDGDTGYVYGWCDQKYFTTDDPNSGTPNVKFYGRQGTTFYNPSGKTDGYFPGISSGDIFMVALDLDNNKIWFGNNGTWHNTNGSSGNTSYSSTTLNSSYPDATGVTIDTSGAGVYMPMTASYNDGFLEYNFGNGYFGTTAITSAGSNGNGSLFEYDVPSGFYALNTKNINTYG
jgi:hypothetical protein